MLDKPLNRRKFLKAAMFGATAGIVAACAPQTTPTGTTPQAETKVEATKEGVQEAAATAAPSELSGELIFWGHADHPLYESGQAFMKKYPNVKFTHVEKADWGQAIEAAFAAGSGAPDLAWLEAFQVQLYARRGVLLETTELVKQHEADLAPAKLSEISYQGKYWGIAGDITPNNLWWRPDITEKAGVKDLNPEIKYEEFLQLAKDVKEKTDANLYIMESTFDGQGKLMFMVPLYSLGGNVSDENGEEILLDNEAGIQAMEYAKQAWDLQAGLDAPWMGPPYWGAVKENKLAGTYSPPWMRGFFEANAKSAEEGIGKWRNMLLPQYTGATVRSNVWGGASLCSFTQTTVPDLVKAYMEFTFATMEGSQVTGDWGIIPPYIPWLKSDFKNTKQTLFEPDWDWTGEVVKAMEQMRTDFYRMPAYGIADANLAKFALPIFKGEKSVADGMKEFADFVREENKKQMEAIQ
jgi:ABC-type glycerol-3-phosphate transport system substrate-binding protein